MSEYIIKMGQVESIEDECDGLRIKARIAQDGDKEIKDLPYSFPLLPKTVQSIPKIGECVLILSSKTGGALSNRYYIGPIISQYQFFEKDNYGYGRGSAISLLKGGVVKPKERISKYDSTVGAFPNKGDIALIGRKSEDVSLKDGEIDIRCGIREKGEEDENLLGNVIFNNINPAYIQLKFKRGLCMDKDQEADSVINLVADKINLISHNNDEPLNITDKNELIKSDELDSVMNKLHKIPYGDLLVEALNKIRESISNHVHPISGLPPCRSDVINTLDGIDFNKILSNNVRIS